MSNEEMSANRPLIEVQSAPVYEFLMTLCVMSVPDTYKTYNIGIKWFRKVRKQVSASLLNALERFDSRCEKVWTHLLGLASRSPELGDVPAFLRLLEETDKTELLLHLVGYYMPLYHRSTPAEVIRQAVEGNGAAQQQFLKTSFPDDESWQNALYQFLSLNYETVKSRLVKLLRSWYEQLFCDQWPEWRPLIERDMQEKQMLQQSMEPKQLIETVTGFQYVPEPNFQRVLLIPTFIIRPWVVSSEYRNIKIYCYPVADETIASVKTVYDSDVPPEHLVELVKALADERRLRILKSLTRGNYTLQELADEFGIAKTTMIHHLALLRATGLLRQRTDDKRYVLRYEGLDSVSTWLKQYLKGQTE